MEGFLTMSPEPFQNPTRCTDVVTPYSSVSSDSWTHAPLYITTNSPPPRLLFPLLSSFVVIFFFITIVIIVITIVIIIDLH